MLFCVPGLHPLRPFAPGLALSAALLIVGCSGDMAPPGELLSDVQPVAPVILSEPAPLPMIDSGPVEPSLYGATETALVPDVPAQNVLAYPISAGVDSTQMTSALPEGSVDQPVVSGIGTDELQLASDAAPQSAPVSGGVLISPDELTSDQNIGPVEPQRQPVRLAGLMPRVQNPMSAPQWAGGMPAAEKACRQRLKRLGVTFRDIPAVNSGPGCSIPYPVELTQLSGGIEIKPAAKLNCQITDAFAQWVKNELAPAARTRYLSGIKSIRQLSSYSCRTMNSKRGAPMSEHAKGNAIDVGRITLNNGKTIAVKQPGFFAFREKSLLNTVRADSCKYFTTVLGPGSDIFHKDHFHFDLRTRKTGYRHCD